MPMLPRRLARAILVPACLILAAGAGLGVEGGTAGPGPVEIQFLTTNDIHGHIVTRRGDLGGVGALARLVDEKRQRATVDGFDIVLIDAGDLLGGSPEDGLTRGAMMAEFAARMKYDIYVPGNHDFGYGIAILRNLIGRLKGVGTQVLAINMLEERTGKMPADLVQGSVVIEREGIKIGFIGATTAAITNLCLDEQFRGFKFPDPLARVKREVGRFKEQGIHNVVLVSHIGFDNAVFQDEKKLASKIPGLMAIVGGHSHTAMAVPYIDPTHKTIVVQSGANLELCGSLSFFFDRVTGRPVDANADGIPDHTWKLVNMERDPAEHPIERDLRSTFFEPLSKQLDEVLGQVDVPLRRRFYKDESRLANFTADAIRAVDPGADFGFIATSSLRGDAQAGPFTLRDAYQVLPFENEVVSVPMPGSLVKSLIDTKYGPGRQFIALAGLKVVADSRKPGGQRVESLQMNRHELEADKVYRVVITDYMAEGKGGFPELAGRGAAMRTGTEMRVAMMRMVQKLGRVASKDIEMGRMEDRYLSEPIGETKIKLGDDMLEGYPGVYDVLAQSMIEPPVVGDMSMISAKDVRWTIKAGKPITQKDLIEITPWNNPLVAVALTGAQLHQVVKRFIDYAKQSSEFPAYFSGCRLEVGPEHDGGFKLEVGGKPVDPAKTYRVITYSYLLTGPPGFEAFGELGLKGEGQEGMLRDAVVRFVKAHTPINSSTFPPTPRLVHPVIEARPRKGEGDN